jgi:hypothetical protein
MHSKVVGRGFLFCLVCVVLYNQYIMKGKLSIGPSQNLMYKMFYFITLAFQFTVEFLEHSVYLKNVAVNTWQHMVIWSCHRDDSL